MNDLLLDLQEVEHRISSLKLLGCKGTTVTQASFLELFDGDHAKCVALDQKIASEMGFEATVPVSGQTYSGRRTTWYFPRCPVLPSPASKFATDMRLLCNLKEVEEPFGGSSDRFLRHAL